MNDDPGLREVATGQIDNKLRTWLGIQTFKALARFYRGIQCIDPQTGTVLVEITAAGVITLKTAGSGMRIVIDPTNGIVSYASGGNTIALGGNHLVSSTASFDYDCYLDEFKAPDLRIAGYANGSKVVDTDGAWVGPLIPVAKGGTNANSAGDARANLGLGSMAVENTGANGSFTTVDSKTVTVTNGIITAIV